MFKKRKVYYLDFFLNLIQNFFICENMKNSKNAHKYLMAAQNAFKPQLFIGSKD